MKKNLRKLFIIILLFVLLIPITYSYALSLVELEMKEKQFFEISKTEVTKNEEVEMIINLDNINYNEFIFELKSDEIIENLEIAQSDEIEAEKNNNEIVMEINKEKANVKTINLFYSIPKNKNVGDTIKFIATITSITNNENSEEESELTTENNKQKQESQSIEFEIKIIEGNQEDNKLENEMPSEENNKQEIGNNQIPNQNNESSTVTQKVPINYSNIQYNSMSNISVSNNQVEKVTYNGSDNNYLIELAVDGYTFNRAFSKESTTYFITVENDIEKLDITAKAQDDEATVSIYGNEELKEGTNKILIAITAENGDVRNYRIYVTKNV